MENYLMLIEQALEVCEKYEGTGYKFEHGDLKEFFQDDMLRTGYLLATMDGVLDRKELALICNTFHVTNDERILKDYYYEDVCRKNNYLQRIPKSIMYVLCEERKELKNSFNIFLKDTRILYKALKQFAYSMITCNSMNLPYQIVALEEMSRNILNLILSAEDMDVYFEEMDIGTPVISIKKIRQNPSDNSNMGDNYYQRSSGKTNYYDPYKGSKDYTNNYDLIRQRDDTENSYGSNSKNDNENNEKNSGKIIGGLYLNKDKEDEEENKNRVLLNNDAELEEILKEVDEMIGLEGVKKEIHNLVNVLQVQKMREDRGLKYPVMSNHLVFTGNPGTGKTTVARKIAKIYRCLGILERGQLIETDRSGLVAGYMGQTAEKVNEVVEKAMGGILFIDEAYALSNNKLEGDFGQEAIDTLLKVMEDKRDNFVVIVAGYPEPMEEFLDSNPGLRSRFNKYVRFEDYSVSQLNDIFIGLCTSQDYILSDEAKAELLLKIGQMVAESKENFANAREVRNLFEKVVTAQANRIMNQPGKDMDSLITIEKEDLLQCHLITKI